MNLTEATRLAKKAKEEKEMTNNNMKENLDNIIEIYNQLSGYKLQLLKVFLPDFICVKFTNRINMVAEFSCDEISVEVSYGRILVYINDEIVYKYYQESNEINEYNKSIFYFIKVISDMLSKSFEKYKNNSSHISERQEMILTKVSDKLSRYISTETFLESYEG